MVEFITKNRSKLLKERTSPFCMTMVLLTNDNGKRQWKDVNELFQRTFDDAEVQGRYDGYNQLNWIGG